MEAGFELKHSISHIHTNTHTYVHTYNIIHVPQIVEWNGDLLVHNGTEWNGDSGNDATS